MLFFLLWFLLLLLFDFKYSSSVDAVVAQRYCLNVNVIVAYSFPTQGSDFIFIFFGTEEKRLVEFRYLTRNVSKIWQKWRTEYFNTGL